MFFKRILTNKSTEQFSGIPYPMTLLNCLLSAWYGLPFVLKHYTLVTVINGTGAGIEAIYMLIFIIYAPKKEKAKVLGLVTFVLAAFSTVALISVFALHGKSRCYFCGFAAAIFSVIMYGSPLSIMRTVIKTKSVEFMPFFLSLFVFLCGTSWFIFGLLGNDPFVYYDLELVFVKNSHAFVHEYMKKPEFIELMRRLGALGDGNQDQSTLSPDEWEVAYLYLAYVLRKVCNGFRSVLGALQLILYAIYRNNKGHKDEKPAAAKDGGGSAMEMGLVKHRLNISICKLSKAFFGVFDGHGGAKAAEFSAKNLNKNIMSEVANKHEDELADAVREGYLATNSKFLKEDVNGGTCCLTALIRKGNLIVSNAGDCRAVMSRNGVAEALTVDHKPSRKDEKDRIESMGGYVDSRNGVWRIQGSLAVSRAIGDKHLANIY